MIYYKYNDEEETLMVKKLLTLFVITCVIFMQIPVRQAYGIDVSKPIYIVKPDSETYNCNMMNFSTYNQYTKQYYLLRSYLEQLERTGGGTLILEPGKYTITNTLYVPSNVTIYMKDGVIIEKGNVTGSTVIQPAASIFQLIRPSYSTQLGVFGGYAGEKNIKFIGQGSVVIDMKYYIDGIAIIAGHNSGLLVENISFKNMNSGHFIEMDATENGVVRNCQFLDSYPSLKQNKEAINIDTPDRATEGWSQEWSKFDKTPNRNIVIEGNKFYNLDRAVGTHKYSEGKYHDKIVLRNNIIEKTRQDSIRVMNWSNAVIQNNTIRNVAGGSGVYRAILASGALNPTFQYNSIDTASRPMQFMPWKNEGPGQEYNITYNNLSLTNKQALYKNYITHVTESFMRINNEYNVFDRNTEKLYLNNSSFVMTDKVAPPTPTINIISDLETLIKGKTEPGAVVTAKRGDVLLGEATTDANGNFQISMSPQIAGAIINVTAKDKKGNVSQINSETVIKHELLVMPKALTYNQREVVKRFQQFYIYGPADAPILDLSDKNSLIKSYLTATNMLASVTDGLPSDRQKFLDAWNKLSTEEKSNTQMKAIYAEYKKMISILQAAQASFKFYEDVKANGSELIINKAKAVALNDKLNMQLGARGKAYKEYSEATAYGENSSNSARMKYINQKYTDTVNFLEVAEYLGSTNLESAKIEAAKIQDTTLKKIADNKINKYIYNQANVLDKFKAFCIYGPVESPIIDLSNKDQSIVKYSQAVAMLKTTEDGIIYDRQRFLDAWNKLSDIEKQYPKMKEVISQYNNLVDILQAAEGCLKFYEDVKLNASSLIYDKDKAVILNSTSNMELGARGKAYKEYVEATLTGEDSNNSIRMKYLSNKYLDTVSFLKVAEFLGNNDISSAEIEASKIQDETLKKIANEAIYWAY